VVNETGKYAVVRADGLVENVVVWDGVTEWNPCHEDDQVIFCDEEYVGPGFTLLEDGSFAAPSAEI
jgi:hypothetical protein